MKSDAASCPSEYISNLMSMKERRSKAVRMVELGFARATAASTFRIKKTYLEAALSRAGKKKAAAQAVNPISKLGAPSKIPGDIAEEVQVIIRNTLPYDHGLVDVFWGREKLGELLKTKYNIAIDRRSIDSAYIRWGLESGDVYKIACRKYGVEASTWIEYTYPSEHGKVMRSEGEIRWMYVKDAPPIVSSKTPSQTQRRTNANFQVTLYVKNRKRTYFVEQLDGTEIIEKIASTGSKKWIYGVLVNDSSQTITVSESVISTNGISVKIAKTFGQIATTPAPSIEDNTIALGGFSATERTFRNGKISAENGVITITNALHGSDFTETKRLNLNEYWLPVTSFCRTPSRLSDEAHLCEIIYACVVESLLRGGWSKSSITIAISSARTVIKLIEWCWYRGIPSPFALPQVDFDDLAEAVARGGWQEPLDIEKRTARFLSQHTREEILSLLTKDKSRNSSGLSSKFNVALGTSLCGRELQHARVLVLDHLGFTATPKKGKRISDANSVTANPTQSKTKGTSNLRQEFSAINLLGEIDIGPLGFIPYPRTKKLADLLGKQTGRTPNFTPDSVAILLGEAFRQVKVVGPILVKLLNEYLSLIFDSHPGPTKFNAKLNELKACNAFNSLENAVGKKISSFGLLTRSPHTSIAQVVHEVQFSIAIIIAFLNARRKDEIISSRTGLYRGSLQCIDEELKLFSAYFYIEKSFRDYVPFLVSDHSVTAIKLLEELNEIQFKWRTAGEDARIGRGRHIKLFSVPLPTPAYRRKTSYFQLKYGAGERSHQFLHRILGEESVGDFGLHVGRRAYALIFFYRYENASLLALAYQFGAFSVDRVRTYISDVLGQRGGVRATDYGPIRTSEALAKQADLTDLERDITEVSQERLREIVADILSNCPTRAGLFSRLVQRVHQKLIGLIEYQNLPPGSETQVISDLLVSKGHRVEPFPHGNCLASTTKPSAAAKCSVSGIPVRSNASIEVCTNCIYHDYVEQHQDSARQVISELKAQLSASPQMSVRGQQLANSINNAESWLMFRAARISSTLRDSTNEGK